MLDESMFWRGAGPGSPLRAPGLVEADSDADPIGMMPPFPRRDNTHRPRIYTSHSQGSICCVPSWQGGLRSAIEQAASNLAIGTSQARARGANHGGIERG